MLCFSPLEMPCVKVLIKTFLFSSTSFSSTSLSEKFIFFLFHFFTGSDEVVTGPAQNGKQSDYFTTAQREAGSVPAQKANLSHTMIQMNIWQAFLLLKPTEHNNCKTEMIKCFKNYG